MEEQPRGHFPTLRSNTPTRPPYSSNRSARRSSSSAPRLSTRRRSAGEMSANDTIREQDFETVRGLRPPSPGSSRSHSEAQSFHFDFTPYAPDDEGGSITAESPSVKNLTTEPQTARSYYTEDKALHRVLGTWDVAALIMNKMIGGGIFTTPGIVLRLTGSKRMSIALWAIGGIYSMFSFSIYLEYGLNFRFNGGDLIYLDEVWPWPELLSTVLYSSFFVMFGTNAGNCVAFAKYCLAAALPNRDNTVGFDKSLIDLIAVVVLSAVCLILYFSNAITLSLNRILAGYKIGLLFTVFVAGVLVRGNTNSGINDWGPHPQPTNDHSALDVLSAMIYIIYSYQGWENANYVGGEIKADKPTLRNGGFLAVFLTMTLYILATVGYFLACNFIDITATNSDLGMGKYFATAAFSGHTVGFKVCIALSAFGNLIAVVYTNAKVKQCIARQQIIPFYRFFAADSHFQTTGGALFLHWLCTLPFILAMPKSTDGYSFVIGMYSYMHLFVLIAVGLGVFRLRSRLQTTEYAFLKWKWVRRGMVFAFVGVNGIVLGVSAKPKASGDIPRFWWPVISAITLVFGALYWLSLWSLQEDRIGARTLGVDIVVHRNERGDLPADYDESKPGAMSKDFKKLMVQAAKDGSNRRVEWKVNPCWEKVTKPARSFVDFVRYFL